MMETSKIQKKMEYTFEELRSSIVRKNIPRCSGIYKVYMPPNFRVKFRADSDAPYKAYDVDKLLEKWETICNFSGYEDGLLYIGKADNLRSRISQYVRTGGGKRANHRGGRAIFQLENNRQLQIKIYECENCKEREAEEIDTYLNFRKALPLANWSRGKKT